MEYTADSLNGFRAAATNLPKATLAGISDTPEVAQARAEHLRAFNEASLRAAAESENQPAQQITAAAAPATNSQQILAVRTSPTSGAFSYSFNTPAFYNGPQFIAARSLPFAIQLNNNQNNNNNFNNGPQDTPEVALARAEHLQAVEEQKARIAAAQ